jgi:Putative beta-barrel porin 2
MQIYLNALMPLSSLIVPSRLLKKAALFIWMAIMSFSAEADWTTKLDNSAFYTDDVALFSVTRRLSLKDDPTQPTVDRPGQGGDFVYEPGATLEWQGENTLGKLLMAMDASGYIFAEQSDFSHGLYEFRLAQTFTNETKISLHYNFVPDLFLGKNAFRQTNGAESEQDEKLTSYYWSLRLDQPLTNTLTIRLLGRYGLRNYNEPFQHRDTQFWTLGPHLEWVINQDMELLMGYHYEQGTAAHQRTTQFPDDVSYINHYASAEFKIRLLDKLTGVFIFDYETNAFTSRRIDDEHLGASENVYQGEIELLYELNESATVKLGWQHGSRKLTTEQQSIKNNNVWLGLEYVF